jgi:hypothetical protein
MDTSYLSQQVSTIITKLHGLYDEMGVPTQERDARDSEVSWSGRVLEMKHVKMTRSCSNLCQRRYKIMFSTSRGMPTDTTKAQNNR